MTTTFESDWENKRLQEEIESLRAKVKKLEDEVTHWIVTAGEEAQRGNELAEQVAELEAKHEAEPVYQIKDPDAIGIWCDVDKDTYDSYRDNLEKRALYPHPPKHEALQPNPWRDAVDHELVMCEMVASEDPRESIRRLIDWNCSVALDPLVSSDARELIDRGRKEATQAAVDAALIKAAEVADCRCDTLLCGCADAILALSLDDSHLRGLMMRVAMKVAYSSAGVAVYKRIVDEELGKTK